MWTSDTPVSEMLLDLSNGTNRLQVMIAEWQHQPGSLLVLRRIRNQAEEVAKRANDAVMIASSGRRA